MFIAKPLASRAETLELRRGSNILCFTNSLLNSNTNSYLQDIPSTAQQISLVEILALQYKHPKTSILGHTTILKTDNKLQLNR